MSEENQNEFNDSVFKISVCREPFQIRSITQIESEPTAPQTQTSYEQISTNNQKKRNLTDDLDDNNNVDDSKRPRSATSVDESDLDVDLTDVKLKVNSKLIRQDNDPSKIDYWKLVYDTELYRKKTLRIQNLINRDFGLKNKYYGFESPRLYINKTINSLDLVRRMKLSYKLSYHEGCVNSLNFNRIGTLLCSGSDDYQVCLWDWARNNLVLAFDSGHKSNVFQSKFMPFTGDSQIITCARDGQVRLALISSSGTHIGTKKLAKHTDSCHKISIEYDSCNLFLSCGEDGVVYEIDLRQSTPAKILTCKFENRNYKLPLYSISTNPLDTYQFIVTGKDQHVRLYDKRMLANNNTNVIKFFTPEHLKESQRASITSAVFNNTGSEIVASYSDDDIYLFDVNDSNFKYRYKGHRNSDTIKGVNFYGASCDYIVSGSDCGRVFFWEKSTQQIVNIQKGDENGIVNVLEPHPNFPILATSGLDSDIKIWSPISEEATNLDNLNEILRENQRNREQSRHFSLSSFEFELLLLLMHRPNNRVFFRSNEIGTDEMFMSSRSDVSSEDDNQTVSRFSGFIRSEDLDEEDEDNIDDDDEDEEGEDYEDEVEEDEEEDHDIGADFEDYFDQEDYFVQHRDSSEES